MSAIISKCGRYRYLLERDLPNPAGVSTFIMLNPSTADAEKDDPTIRRCKAFVKSWGHGRLSVVNLFAFRATKPADMKAAADPVGPDNDKEIFATAKYSQRTRGNVVCAWGTHGKHMDRDREILAFLLRHGIEPLCLGTTADGSPRHPLYVRGDQPLIPYRGRP